VAVAGAALAFALGFEWIRSGRCAWVRMLRAALTVAAVGFVPSLLAAPYQAFALLALGRLLALAAAYAIAAGLAPREGGRPFGWRSPRGTRRPGAVAASLALSVGLSFAAVASTASFRLGEMSMLVIVFLVFTLLLGAIGWRIVRAVLWLGAAMVMVVVGSDPDHGVHALLGTVLIAAISWMFTSPAVSQHFRRRVRVTAQPYPSVSLALGAAAAVLAMVGAARNLEPQSRGELLARLHAPVAIAAPLLYAPDLPPLPPLVAATSGQSLAADPHRGMWVVDEETNQVVLVPAEGQDVRVPVHRWPQQLVVDSAGTVYVSCREGGTVDIVERDYTVSSIAVGAEPRALAFDEAAHRLYVGLVTESSVVAIDTATRTVVERRTLPEAPYALAWTDGTLAALPRLGSHLTLLSAGLETVRAEPLGATGRLAWHGQALIPSRDDLIVAYDSVDTGMEGAVVSNEGGYGGSVRMPVELRVAVLHRGHLLVTPPPLDSKLGIVGSDITGGLARDNELFLISRGTGALLSLRLDELAAPKASSRTALGQGATGLAIDARGRMVTFAAFDRRLVGILTGEVAGTLPPSKLNPELALGRNLFHRSDDRRTSGAGLACATCHPDGMQDGLVWRLKGTRVQTPMLAAKIADTAPYNWHGSAPTLEENISQTIKRLGGNGLPDAERHALARYLRKGLHAPTRPKISDDPLVALGREVFSRPAVGCADCHTVDGTFTDSARHDVGTLSAQERGELAAAGDRTKDPAAFDTPSLLGVGLTQPYFHNGSAPSLEALIASNRDRMGHTSGLSEREKRALVAFLKTL
jgi:cytochrome c peroxidase